jgi:hypothetical protein
MRSTPPAEVVVDLSSGNCKVGPCSRADRFDARHGIPCLRQPCRSRDQRPKCVRKRLGLQPKRVLKARLKLERSLNPHRYANIDIG